MAEMNHLESKVTRIEVIDGTGRVFAGYFTEPGAFIMVQDEGRTIKVFQNGKRQSG